MNNETTHDYTSEQIDQLYKSMDDPIYFIENFCVINTVDGPKPFKLHPYQKRMIMAYHTNQRVSCLVARQLGKTIVTAAYMLWFSIFKANKTSMITAHNFAGATAIMSMIHGMIDALPEWMIPTVRERQKQSVIFSNGSRIYARALTPTACRGMSLSLLYIDEAAYARDNMMDEFWMAVMPTMAATNGQIIMTSSLNGKDDMFYKIRQNAEESKFTTMTFTWRDHPDRTDEWRIEEIKKIGYKNFYREHECEIHTINELYREIEQLRYELTRQA